MSGDFCTVSRRDQRFNVLIFKCVTKEDDLSFFLMKLGLHDLWLGYRRYHCNRHKHGLTLKHKTNYLFILKCTYHEFFFKPCLMALK